MTEPRIFGAGDLARAVTHESDDSWPDKIEIRAKWKTQKGGWRLRTVEIDGDEFFGRGRFGAPISGDRLVVMIDRLRRA